MSPPRDCVVLNRRGFLGVLMGLAAAPVLTKLNLLDASAGIAVVERPLILPFIPHGGTVFGIDVFGTAGISSPAMLRLLRHNGDDVMRLHLNAHGGVVQWRAALWDGGIVSTIGQPLVIDVSPDCAVGIAYRTLAGDIRTLTMDREFA